MFAIFYFVFLRGVRTAGVRGILFCLRGVRTAGVRDILFCFLSAHLYLRAAGVLDIVFCDCDGSDVLVLWNFVHNVEHKFLYD